MYYEDSGPVYITRNFQIDFQKIPSIHKNDTLFPEM